MALLPSSDQLPSPSPSPGLSSLVDSRRGGAQRPQHLHGGLSDLFNEADSDDTDAESDTAGFDEDAHFDVSHLTSDCTSRSGGGAAPVLRSLARGFLMEGGSGGLAAGKLRVAGSRGLAMESAEPEEVKAVVVQDPLAPDSIRFDWGDQDKVKIKRSLRPSDALNEDRYDFCLVVADIPPERDAPGRGPFQQCASRLGKLVCCGRRCRCCTCCLGTCGSSSRGSSRDATAA